MKINRALRAIAILLRTFMSVPRVFSSRSKSLTHAFIYVNMAAKKNIVGDGNIDGTPIVSRREILMVFEYMNPGMHTAACALAPAPAGEILPTTEAKDL
jgi:hypothetical protein